VSVKPGQVYSAEEVVPSAAAADKNFKGPKVPEGRVVRIEVLVVIDLTTANKTLRLGFDRAGTSYWLKRQAAGSSTYGIILDRPLILVEGEAPIARVESATAADALYFLARGVYL